MLQLFFTLRMTAMQEMIIGEDMAATVSPQILINEARDLLQKANENIFTRMANQQRVYRVLNRAQKSLEDAKNCPLEPRTSLIHIADVACIIASTSIKFLESQNQNLDITEIGSALQYIHIAQYDVDFPDENNGDIFEQTSHLLQATKRVVDTAARS